MSAHPETVSATELTPKGATAAPALSEMTGNPFDNGGWRASAACRGLDVNLFIPDGTGNGQLLYTPARQVCDLCIVRQACLDYALANREELGMWGGTTPQERLEIGYGPAAFRCDNCGGKVSRTSANQKFCGGACRQAAHRRSS